MAIPPEMIVAEFVHTQGGVGYNGLVLKQEFMPSLPNFVGFVEATQTLMICEKNPQDLRGHMLIHEISCRVVYKEQSGSCARATNEEYQAVPQGSKALYAALRLEFYRALVRYHTEQGSDPKFIQEITASRELWAQWASP